MSLELSTDVERSIAARVQSGRFRSADDVLREALRLMDERDSLLDEYRKDVEAMIAAGLHSLERGDYVDGDTAFDRLDAKLAKMQSARGG